MTEKTKYVPSSKRTRYVPCKRPWEGWAPRGAMISGDRPAWGVVKDLAWTFFEVNGRRYAEVTNMSWQEQVVEGTVFPARTNDRMGPGDSVWYEIKDD